MCRGLLYEMDRHEWLRLSLDLVCKDGAHSTFTEKECVLYSRSDVNVILIVGNLVASLESCGVCNAMICK